MIKFLVNKPDFGKKTLIKALLILFGVKIPISGKESFNIG